MSDPETIQKLVQVVIDFTTSSVEAINTFLDKLSAHVLRLSSKQRHELTEEEIRLLEIFDQRFPGMLPGTWKQVITTPAGDDLNHGVR